MTTQEFSLEFNLLYNNLDSNIAPGLNEYEKSLLLTESQEMVVREVYTGTGLSAFENSELSRNVLDDLVSQATIVPDDSGIRIDDSRSYTVVLPDDLWLKTLELAVVQDSSLECCDDDTRTADVVAVTQDEFLRTRRNPFRGAEWRRVLRMDTGEKTVELYSKYPVVSYTVRYLRKPTPIILEDLPEGLTIDGYDKEMTCGLNSIIHRTILNGAVNLAKMAWSLTQQSNA